MTPGCRELEHLDVVEAIADGDDLPAVDPEVVDHGLDAECLVDPGQVELAGGLALVRMTSCWVALVIAT